MLSSIAEDQLANILASNGLTYRNKLLVVMASKGNAPLSTKEIKDTAKNAGLLEVENWNISDLLSKSNGLVTKIKGGWILTAEGKDFVSQNFSENPLSTKTAAKGLRHLAGNINNLEARAFIEEAIGCLEVDSKKAAVVFSWIGAVSILYDYIITNRLADFNNEACRRDPKWKPAVTKDDLTRMKEGDFLDVLASISILNKNVKEHLKNTCLNLRNSCGHPNSIRIGKHNVEAHIEFLIQNVFLVFG